MPLGLSRVLLLYSSKSQDFKMYFHTSHCIFLNVPGSACHSFPSLVGDKAVVWQIQARYTLVLNPLLSPNYHSSKKSWNDALLFFLNGFLNTSKRVLDPCQGASSLTEEFKKGWDEGIEHVLFTAQNNLDSSLCVYNSLYCIHYFVHTSDRGSYTNYIDILKLCLKPK